MLRGKGNFRAVVEKTKAEENDRFKERYGATKPLDAMDNFSLICLCRKMDRIIKQYEENGKAETETKISVRYLWAT